MSTTIVTSPADRLMMAALAAIPGSLNKLDASRRRRAEAHVRANNGPGHTDRTPVEWQRIDGGPRHFGSFSDFLAVVDCNRFEVEVELALAATPHRRIIVSGFTLELDLRRTAGGA